MVGDPGRDQLASIGRVPEQRLVQKLVPHPAVEAFEVEQAKVIGPREPATVLHRLTGHDLVPFDLALAAPLQDRVRGQFRPPRHGPRINGASMARSETIVPGLPRRSIRALSSRAMRRLEIEGEPSSSHRFEAHGEGAAIPLLGSSLRANRERGRVLARTSIRIGGLVPTALRRALRLRTVNPSLLRLTFPYCRADRRG
jgi:hypothetical protein